MVFTQLMQALADGSIAATGLAHDSRLVTPGSIFVCLRGHKFDGHNFAEEAAAAGAAFIVGEDDLALSNYVRVADSRQALADLAYAFYGHPNRALRLVGVTGTNGKSTTCHLLASLLNKKHIPTGLVGTLGIFLPQDKRLEEIAYTTPDPVQMARLLARLRQEGARVVAMELSSMALDQRRSLNLDFEAVVFTNLTQDHLDYHQTMENYFQAKRQLLQLPYQRAVINIDDPYGSRLAQEAAHCITVSLEREALIQADRVQIAAEGISFLLKIKGREQPFSVPLHGRHNLYNLLTALGAAMALGQDPFSLLSDPSHLTLPEGRWTIIGHKPTVIVDYAHSPDSIEQVLKLARHIARGRIITLFGCNGDRDREKRPIMGAIVSKYSDFTVLSSDNPATEAPQAIANHVLRGIRGPHLVELDREKAIAAAVGMASGDDLVLILGRGHEVAFNCGAYSFPFYDPDKALHYWRLRQSS